MKKKAAVHPTTELVIITGLSGSGKGTVLKALEDLGYYSVDNLPIDLISKFADLAKNAPNIRRAALVVDIREGQALERFPALFKRIQRQVPTRLILLSRASRPVSAENASGWSPSASWPTPSSTPASSMSTSCAKPSTGPSAHGRAHPRFWCR
jgi:hypothetical protein